ncbi:MAG TPA: zf-TFIIB domain-containing protein [Gemmatimonadaceae bacterium]|nr:zf-TFIIB domain-containing protein [Gemmatimonadaceae bacterium]
MTEPEEVRASGTRKCPRCRVPLEVMAHEGFKGATCPKCEGIWLGADDLLSALRHYATDKGVALKTVALLETPAKPSGLRCPQCPSELQVIALRAIEVEKCPSCRGVFLDRGESEAIAERVMLAKATWEPAHHELMRIVRERLMIERVQRQAGGHHDGWGEL